MSARVGSAELEAATSGVGHRAPSVPPFREIFDTHAPYVWRTLRQFGVHEADAHDMCQEVFTVVARRLPDFDGTSTLRTWVYGITFRVASQYRRSARHRREELTADVPDAGRDATQEADLRQQELLEQLSAALDLLDENKRAVFVLYELQELTMSEVAEALGCPLQTAYSRLHAARAIVREAFGAGPRKRAQR